MSDINGIVIKSQNQNSDPQNPFSNQPTGLVETTLAETLGLSMHNAVSNQQSAQITASASITNACARLLQAPVPAKIKSTQKNVGKVSDDDTEEKTVDTANSNSSNNDQQGSDAKDIKSLAPQKKGTWQKILDAMKRNPKNTP